MSPCGTHVISATHYKQDVQERDNGVSGHEECKWRQHWSQCVQLRAKLSSPTVPHHIQSSQENSCRNVENILPYLIHKTTRKIKKQEKVSILWSNHREPCFTKSLGEKKSKCHSTSCQNNSIFYVLTSNKGRIRRTDPSINTFQVIKINTNTFKPVITHTKTAASNQDISNRTTLIKENTRLTLTSCMFQQLSALLLTRTDQTLQDTEAQQAPSQDSLHPFSGRTAPLLQTPLPEGRDPDRWPPSDSTLRLGAQRAGCPAPPQPDYVPPLVLSPSSIECPETPS